ncbi:BLOC-1-related complex subunit 7-like [Strongylocentrotus purpuratus]|uniref:BLOC-1-related complex subunit 7 n=1 Tax=Strongylocentrotus purpuratus TaxID=7668 RepID=A0A7M7HMV3_STRPU|nr:BLOC-1-related complex subunit 7-like [Strongylocentrotus purpuratus]|eukprot:XP_011668371.1 PREDICTED: UPF0693 protein C10orf32 homolog [Strongylocentrotus purpuratus]
MAMQPHNMDPRLPLKIQENVTDLGSLTRQVLRSSKSNEMLLHAAKNFASQEGTVESSLQTLKKMDILASHLRFQAEAIERNVEVMDTLQDQLSTLQR